MEENELTDWIKLARNSGLTDVKISENLISAGWDPVTVNWHLSDQAKSQQSPKKLTYTITPEEYKQRTGKQKRIYSYFAIPFLILLLLESFIQSGIWITILIIIFLGVLYFSINTYQKKRYGSNWSVELSSEGINILAGGKIKQYTWDQFKHFMTSIDFAKNMPLDERPDISLQRAKAETSAHGNVFYLTFKKQSASKFLLFQGMYSLTLFAEPDNYKQVHEYLKKYLPQREYTPKNRGKAYTIYYVFSIILLAVAVIYLIISFFQTKIY
jgi:hypothetical protein